MNKPMLELLKGLDDEIALATNLADELERIAVHAVDDAQAARQRLDSLVNERGVLEGVARRQGMLDEAEIANRADSTEPDGPEWSDLSRLDAVEHVLKEAKGPLHINHIVSRLTSLGRPNDTYHLVSASLATLKDRRGTVRPVGGGNWIYTPNAMSQLAADTHARIRGGLQLPPPRPEPTDMDRLVSGGPHPEDAAG